MNETTARAVRPAVRDAFAAWLAAYEARYPSFHVAGPVLRAWPDQWFGDGFSHLNPSGAERFSTSGTFQADIAKGLGRETLSAAAGGAAEYAE